MLKKRLKTLDNHVQVPVGWRAEKFPLYFAQPVCRLGAVSVFDIVEIQRVQSIALTIALLRARRHRLAHAVRDQAAAPDVDARTCQTLQPRGRTCTAAGQ